jgi:glycosyltransferase involved in cell wall biosynthesis
MKITGISPIYNTISGGYPFLECLILSLPIVDELWVNDGGSTDGTREALEKFEKKFDKVEIINIPHYESSSYESMDRALEEIIEMIDGGWIYEVQADEYIVDGENLKEEINEADNKNKNSLRQPLHTIHNWATFGDEKKPWQKVRVFKNIGTIKSTIGGDNFYFEGEPKRNENYATHNLFPEYKSKTIIWHLHNLFAEGKIQKAKTHARFYAKEHSHRNELYEKYKKLNNYHVLPRQEEIHDAIHPIFRGLFGMEKYQVREELFDKGWLVNNGVTL